MMKSNERAAASSAGIAALSSLIHMGERAHAEGVYRGTLRGYRDRDAKEFLKHHRLAERTRAGIATAELHGNFPFAAGLRDELVGIERHMETMTEIKGHVEAPNVVVTQGKNYLLDNGLAGSAYTAAFYMGLMSSTSYGAGPVAADTAASHAGWLEAGGANAPAFSGSRKTAAWAAASAGAKALSAGLVFTFTSTGTVKGCFLTTASAVDATTGVLYSAGLFTGGDQPVVATNTLTVTYTASL